MLAEGYRKAKVSFFSQLGRSSLHLRPQKALGLTAPVLCELVRHMGHSMQIAEALASMRDLKLAGTDKQATSQRSAFLQLTRQARAQTQLIAVLSQKLRLTNQSRDGSNGATNAARLRARTPFGRRPWEFISGGASDDDDDQGPPTN